MRHLKDRYLQWRGSSIFRHASFVIAIALTAFSLVVLPGQWVPVLFRDDLTVIGLSLGMLGVGSIAAAASLARRGISAPRSSILPSAGVGVLMVILAVILYKAIFRGIGWPEVHELLLALSFVSACALLGSVTGALTRSWPRGLRSIPTVVVVLLAGAGGAWLFSHLLPKNLEPGYQASQQVCEVRRSVEYCANPGYEPFVGYWQQVVESVLDAAPIEAERSEVLIAQLLDEGRRLQSASAAPGLDWGKGAGQGVAGLGLGLDMANWITGIETTWVTSDPDEPQVLCDPGTGSRSVVAFWLAGQLGDEVQAAISDLGCCADAISGSTFAEPAVGGGWDVAEQLLALPAADVRPELDKHWDELIDPDTPVARITQIFGVDAPEITQVEGDETFPRCPSRYE